MTSTIDRTPNLPRLPLGMFWLGDGNTAERAGLTDAYQERIRMGNLVRLTEPGSLIHERAKARLGEIERTDLR